VTTGRVEKDIVGVEGNEGRKSCGVTGIETEVVEAVGDSQSSAELVSFWPNESSHSLRCSRFGQPFRSGARWSEE